MDPETPATAKDTSVALFKMKSGLTLNWIVGLSGHGNCNGQLILGDRGCIQSFGTRGGRASLKQANREAIGHDEILETVDRFTLDPLTEFFFPDRIATEDVDWKLIALEQHELAQAILEGRKIEVDGIEGLKAVAAVYAICESSHAGKPVRMSDVETCRVYDYQAEIDQALGIG